MKQLWIITGQNILDNSIEPIGVSDDLETAKMLVLDYFGECNIKIFNQKEDLLVWELECTGEDRMITLPDEHGEIYLVSFDLLTLNSLKQ